MSTIKALIVDDHPVFLEGLYTILSLKDPHIEVIGMASDGAEALEKERKLGPDVVLLDIKMPGLSGVEVARRMVERNPKIKILMLTTFDDSELIRSALRSGAKGYLLKESHASKIIEAIKHVHNENFLISGDLVLKLSSSQEPDETDTSPESGEEVVALQDLSEREIEVLRLVAMGKANAEIGAELHLSEKTVRNYISHIYDVIDIHSRTKAALWALRYLEM